MPILVEACRLECGKALADDVERDEKAEWPESDLELRAD